MSEKIVDKDIVLANGKVEYQTLMQEDGCWVSKTTVHPGGETEWHHHTNVSDRFTVVQGVLTVEVQEHGLLRRLEPNDYYAVDAGVVHHVKNETNEVAVYIMVQSGGIRDIVLQSAETRSFGGMGDDRT